MKKKSKNAFLRKRKEFRFHKIKTKTKSGKNIKLIHPAYIFLRKGNIFIYVSITHSKTVNDYLVIELRENPNPKEKSKSYYIAEIKQDTIDNFGEIQKGWQIKSEDDQDIRELFNKKKR